MYESEPEDAFPKPERCWIAPSSLRNLEALSAIFFAKAIQTPGYEPLHEHARDLQKPS